MASYLVYKYTIELKPGQYQKVEMPERAELLAAKLRDNDHNQLDIWTRVCTANRLSFVEIFTGWTGGVMGATPDPALFKHLQTVTDKDGLVWHVFFNKTHATRG